MNAKYRLYSHLLILLIFGMMVLLPVYQASGQSFRENSGRDDFVETDELFLQERERRLGGAKPRDDFSEGGRFVEEERRGPTRGRVTQRSRRTQLGLAEEREQLPLNAAWGAGTGLLIGGWFALIGNGDDRDTQRSIGLGVVLGALLGVFVGTQILINPNAPRAAMHKPARDIHPKRPILVASTALAKTPLKIGFTYHF